MMLIQIQMISSHLIYVKAFSKKDQSLFPHCSNSYLNIDHVIWLVCYHPHPPIKSIALDSEYHSLAQNWLFLVLPQGKATCLKYGEQDRTNTLFKQKKSTAGKLD